MTPPKSTYEAELEEAAKKYASVHLLENELLVFSNCNLTTAQDLFPRVFQRYQDYVAGWNAKAERDTEQIRQLREALEFYANEENLRSLTGLPFGRRAREALKGEES